MHNTILIDFNWFLHMSVYEIDKVNERVNKKNLKIRLLDNLLKVRKKFKGSIKDFIIASDSQSWRKTEFPFYKFKRKENREKDKHDWKEIRILYEEIIQEFKDNLPYKFLKIEECEGDDIIAVLSKCIDGNIIIVSKDGDFEQLQLLKRVKQYSSFTDCYINYKDSEIAYNLFKKLMRGDTGDGIPNILNPLTCFKEGDRQIPLREGYIKEAFEAAKRGNLKEFLDVPITRNKVLESSEESVKRYHRFLENKKLIDFRCIPEEVKEVVINTYTTYEVPKTNLYSYFMTNDLEDFVKDMLWF